MSGARILIVEDELINRELLVDILEAEGFSAVAVTTGAEAWRRLSKFPQAFDLVVLDRMLPDMDGIEVLRRMKAQATLADTPVIMQTSIGGDKAVAEGIKAGAYYYLTKPFSAETLLTIVVAAARDRLAHAQLLQEVRQLPRTLVFLTDARFRFRTTEEARDVAALLAAVAPDPERAVLGLSELMLNAIEHGNLGISYQEKSELLAHDRMASELARRLTAPEYGSRRVTVEFHRQETQLRFVIEDEGDGFDWREYLEMSPDRAFHAHGRGIALARLMSFDELCYKGSGNRVEALIMLPGQERRA